MDMNDAGNSQAPGAPTSRVMAFSQGAGPSPGLQADSAAANANTPKGFTATSVLQPYIQSPNGMAASDASRRLVGGGMLPSANGSAQDTYEAARPIRNNRLSAVGPS